MSPKVVCVRNSRGISLLEVLVGTALMAILAGTAVMGYGVMLSGWRLNAAARQIVMDLKVARSRAIAEAVSHRIQFQVPGRFYEHQRQEAGKQYAATGPPTPLPPEIETIGCTATGSSIGFRPRGHASTFGTITLRNADGDQRQIVVDIAGRVRVQ